MCIITIMGVQCIGAEGTRAPYFLKNVFLKIFIVPAVFKPPQAISTMGG